MTREAGSDREPAPTRPQRERLRLVGGPERKRRSGGDSTGAKQGGKPARTGRVRASRAPRRRRATTSGDARDEILRLGGRRGRKLYDQLVDAADAFSREHEREALRLLRPLVTALPESQTVRELLGLTHYRLGHYPAAAKELEVFVELSNSVEQHPVLMDCYRAQHRWRRVDELWRELAAASPSAEVIAEGRIVSAGALADRGRLHEAIELLAKRDRAVTDPKEHHLRLWYALADLEERAGNLPRARQLFERIRRSDAGFADVPERLAALA